MIGVVLALTLLGPSACRGRIKKSIRISGGGEFVHLADCLGDWVLPWAEWQKGSALD